ncbi:MFS transporter [Cupriavidus agavae]|uniref:Putative MFS family arabinose efflux permease n=1 Tax=Cupriavidus agavae TaxID=1001822 RepID=A0A4Q7R834_9BURK|nr:MFS transporter [Cupriavidus agavae]RZT29021.1 putative MFS family arabinose efflux permease [Cupriavidus agavae]
MTTTKLDRDTAQRGAPLSWYAELGPGGQRAFKASFAGWATDAFDFMVFSFVLTALIDLWHLDRAQAGLLGTVTLVFSAIGGWVAGMLADRYGRVKVLQGTILWFSVCTLLIGFAQNFEQVFVLRALQGLGFGGEWAVGAVLIGEIIAPKHRGKAVGLVQSGWAVGWGAAAILYSIAFSVLPESLAWRSLFWVGILPALLVIYVRKHVPEPDVFRAANAARQQGRRTSVWAIFSGRQLRTTVLAALLCTGIQGGFYAMSTWLPTYLKLERNLSVLDTGGYLLVIIVGSFCGYVVGAHLADFWGRRRNFMVFSALSLASVCLYLTLPLSNAEMLWLGFPLGFASCGIFSGVGAYLTELYPSENRANGQSFTYNFGRGIGALFPTLVGWLSHSTGLATAIAIFSGAAYGVVLLMVLLLPETRGQSLETDHARH